MPALRVIAVRVAQGLRTVEAIVEGEIEVRGLEAHGRRKGAG